MACKEDSAGAVNPFCYLYK